MRHHERTVHRMVDAFYIASRNTSVQKMITTMQGGYFSRKFVTFVGGDFDQNSAYIARIRIYSKICAALFGNDDNRAPNHPAYYSLVPFEQCFSDFGILSEPGQLYKQSLADSYQKRTQHGPNKHQQHDHIAGIGQYKFAVLYCSFS